MEMSRDPARHPRADDEDARTARVPIKGQGAASRVAGRLEARIVRGEDDGWGAVD